jgi:predicted Zn-dependent protease
MRMTGHRFAGVVIALMLLALSGAARAETIEVAPGVRVTKTTYDAPVNEQPFYGFITKTARLRAVDEEFVTAVIAAAGSREQAFEAATLRGWKAILGGRAAEAAKRFNQAYLLMPERSEVYHGLAMVAQMRFNDLAFADELFRQAYKQPHPLKMLNADYGRLLLMQKRYRDAQPVLEKAVVDTADFGDAWAYLAFAKLQNGDKTGACADAAEARKHKPSRNTVRDLAHIEKDAQCN